MSFHTLIQTHTRTNTRRHTSLACAPFSSPTISPADRPTNRQPTPPFFSSTLPGLGTHKRELVAENIKLLVWNGTRHLSSACESLWACCLTKSRVCTSGIGRRAEDRNRLNLLHSLKRNTLTESHFFQYLLHVKFSFERKEN